MSFGYGTNFIPEIARDEPLHGDVPIKNPMTDSNQRLTNRLKDPGAGSIPLKMGNTGLKEALRHAATGQVRTNTFKPGRFHK